MATDLVVAAPNQYADNNPLNRTDPLGLRPDDCIGTVVCVIDDLGGPVGTNFDPSTGGRSVKEGAGRTKDDGPTAWFKDRAGEKLGIYRPYNVGDYTDEIYWAAIHAGMDTRLVYAVIAKESERGVQSPATDMVSIAREAATGRNANIGPGNVSLEVFQSVQERHSDIFGGASWFDLMSNKTLATKVTAFRLRDLNDDLDGSIARHRGIVTRIFKPHSCAGTDQSPRTPTVFCRSTLLTAAYVQPLRSTLNGRYFDLVFRDRQVRVHNNEEFRPAAGDVINAATPYMWQAWNYYCGDGGHFRC